MQVSPNPAFRPTISVLCPTRHPGAVVNAVLAPLRKTVDEIIIAADSRAEAGDLAWYAAVADTVLRFEFSGANRHWPWLAAQARGDWLLILDGDELLSEALMGALRELAADRRISQYDLPIHWPWPGPDRRLCGEPWDSGTRLRLVRNDGRLRFIARKHGILAPAGPVRTFEQLPVYHLDLLLADEEQRAAKVARYDRELFGLMTPEGLPFNEAFYLPERAAAPPPTVAIPRGEADRISGVLADRGRPAPPSVDLGTLQYADRARVTWYAPRDDLPDEAYRASLRLARELPAFTAGRAYHQVLVGVRNEGEARWPAGEGAVPVLGIRTAWIDGADTPLETTWTPLPHILEPGEEAVVPVGVAAMSVRGEARLAIEVVREPGRVVGDRLTLRVDVGPSADACLADLVSTHGELLPVDAVLAARRISAGADGLLRASPDPAARPSDPTVRSATDGLPVGEWALDGETLDRVAAIVRERRPSVVVEFGTGTSTVALAALLAESGDPDARVLSFEESPDWGGHVNHLLAERGLAGRVSIVCLPLVGPTDDLPAGYGLTPEADELLRAYPPDLVLVDGPTLGSGASRLGTVPLVAPFVERDAVLLLDDALRDAELLIASVWSGRDDVIVDGLRPTAKGLLEGRLLAAPRDAGSRRVISTAGPRALE